MRVLQRVAVCCSMLQRGAACCSVVQCLDDLILRSVRSKIPCKLLRTIVRVRVLQCVAVCQSVLQRGVVWCSVLQRVAVP